MSPKLLRMILSFHQDMFRTVQFVGSCCEPFPIKNGVKQGCVLAPALFGIFVSLLLSYAFMNSEDGIYIHVRSDGGLFNLACLHAKTKVQRVLIRKMHRVWPHHQLEKGPGYGPGHQQCSQGIHRRPHP